MFNSIHSTTVSLAGVVFRCSGTMSRWNKQVQFLTPHPQLLHPQPPLQSQPTSLTSDSISSQPVVPIIESNPFISQLNPFVHLPSTNIINTLCHLSYTLEQPQTTSPIKVCVLDVFDGTDLHQLYQFLFQCCFYFCSELTVFKSDFDKINFAMTYVSGVVQDWLQVALEQENQGVHHTWLYSWSSFVKKIVMINLISYRCSLLCNHMDHFFVSDYFIYPMAQSVPHWWGMFFTKCHKLHSAISSPILRRFSQSQWLQKALEKTFRSIPLVPQNNQYWPRY